MTNETACHGAIFLLDPDLVVAAVRSGMGEFDTMVGAVLDQRLVDQRASLSESILRMGKGNLQEVRRRSVPIIVGTYRNAFSHRLSPPAFAPAARSGTDRFQETDESGGTGSQWPVSYLGVAIDVAMAFQGIHQVGQR